MLQLALASRRPGPAHCGMSGFVGFLTEALWISELSEMQFFYIIDEFSVI